jgi:hypothetical protein
MRNASAADAAAERLRKERRDAEGTLKWFSWETVSWVAINHLVPPILPQNPALTSPIGCAAESKLDDSCPMIRVRLSVGTGLAPPGSEETLGRAAQTNKKYRILVLTFRLQRDSQGIGTKSIPFFQEVP